MSTRKITRREMLKLSGTAAFGACWLLVQRRQQHHRLQPRPARQPMLPRRLLLLLYLAQLQSL